MALAPRPATPPPFPRRTAAGREHPSRIPHPAGSGLFARTRWSLVRRAAAGDAGARGALGEWLGVYWYPLYAWARRRGLSPEDASDGVQSFLEKMCAQQLLARADITRGKLRSWLLKSFSNHLASEDTRAAGTSAEAAPRICPSTGPAPNPPTSPSPRSP